MKKHFGRSSRTFAATISWAQLLASAGMTAIVHDAVDPSTDLPRLIRFVRDEAASLGIDASRLGVLAASGNAPAALAAIASCEVQCAILLMPSRWIGLATRRWRPPLSSSELRTRVSD